MLVSNIYMQDMLTWWTACAWQPT